ncbi:hypothetical protein CLV33_10414 [Jejuia pallidilutea]|uniref:Uncharacterized protein n=1 Tax=Jejuia pallidilutea TaxID=504487 RepID=A0A362WZV7_9FLAO|nr:BfmA/BtgA family mobilization protein [Jejuia pallidilutea]PQV48809.1 hypothetical protein CLV33_10414 [Jejuia pallidilutea]
MDTFSTIRFKIKTANRFRKFSLQVAQTHTEALESMLNFFDWNDLSPTDNLGLKSERINKRINAVIAILKNIEKHQTKPTTIMLQRLFEETTTIEKEEIFEFETPKLITENEELEHYRESYYIAQEQFTTLKYDLESLIEKAKYIKGSFSPGYFKLEMTKAEFEAIKERGKMFKNVHHDNTTKTRR